MQADTASTRNQVFSTQYSIDAVDLNRPSGADEACFGADSIVLAVVAESDQPVQVMLTVGLEAPVADAEALDRPADLDLGDTPPPGGKGEGAPLVGGLSFAGAPEVNPGRYRLLMGLDESAVVKVPVEWGQQLSVTSRVRNPEAALSIGIDGFGPDLGPVRGAVRGSNGYHRTRVEPGQTDIYEYALPQVRYTNRMQSSASNAARAGFHYITVFAIPSATDDAKPGDLVTVELDIARIGEARTEPDYATTDDSIASDPSGQDPSSASAAPSAVLRQRSCRTCRF